MAWFERWTGRFQRGSQGPGDGVRRELDSGQMVGEYRIERKLGEGGFGAVYQAVHPVIGKRAAVKVLHPRYSTNSEIVSRFIDEARAVNQIRHHNIVDIFSFGMLEDGRQYYVMELLDGAALDEYLERVGRLGVEQSLAILLPVARALEAAHGAGIAHRDLKPENVFLEIADDGRVFPRVLDFGIAKLLSDKSRDGRHKTRTGTPIGSPRYMSPEQCQGVEVDCRTDEYAFGVMVHRMLTGSLPFEAKTAFDLMLMHVGAEPPPMSTSCEDVKPELDAPVLRMLSKSPKDRYASVMEAFRALEDAAIAAGFDKTSWTGAGPEATRELVELSETRPNARARTDASRSDLLGAGSSDVRSSGRWRAPAFGLLAIAATTAGVLVVASRSRQAGSASVQEPSSAWNVVESTPSQPAAAASPSSSAVPPASIAITLRTRPADAEVFQGDIRLGVAPGPFHLPVASGSTVLTVRAPGHAAASVEVGRGVDSVVGVTLKPAPRPASDVTVPKDLEYPY
ncbi:MAG: serine/threonine protein kinase [Deltaproteobacteria bacterium]|nr:serine/threonine protein kinase [Deltaproteobacteria bacterium]